MPDSILHGLQAPHWLGILLLSVALLVVVLELVRRNLLKERYALLWLVTAAAGLAVGVFPALIVFTADLFNFQYLTVVFAMYFFFSFGLLLNFSIVISTLSERNRALSQEVALLGHAIHRLEKRLDG